MGRDFLRFRLAYYYEPELYYEMYQLHCRAYVKGQEREQIPEKGEETNSFIVSRFMRRT